jgi:hypothetical protein
MLALICVKCMCETARDVNENTSSDRRMMHVLSSALPVKRRYEVEARRTAYL